MKETPFLNGRGFYLRELRESDLAGGWYRWFNDAEVTVHMDKKLIPNTVEKQRAYYNYLQDSATDVVLAIVESDSHAHIGNVGLHKINWVHRSAEIGIVLGDKAHWGKGFGKQAWRLITQYAFETLNLNRLYAYSLVDNKGSIGCAEASGFKQIGVISDFLYKNGEYRDGVYMNLVRREFSQ